MRAPVLADAPALAALARDTFVETFGHLYTPDNLDQFLATACTTEAMQEDIGDPERVIRVIEEDGELVAFCKIGLFSGLDFDHGPGRWMELKQLYLRSGQQGTGVANVLMDWVKSEATIRKYDSIILGVWNQNFRAHRFYERHGFRKIGETYFMVGNHRDDEFVMGLELRPANTQDTSVLAA